MQKGFNMSFLFGVVVGATAWHFFGAMAIELVKTLLKKKDAP